MLTIIEIAPGFPEPDIKQCGSVADCYNLMRRLHPDKPVKRGEKFVAVDNPQNSSERLLLVVEKGGKP